MNISPFRLVQPIDLEEGQAKPQALSFWYRQTEIGYWIYSIYQTTCTSFIGGIFEQRLHTVY